jgi:hypothetical protein
VGQIDLAMALGQVPFHGAHAPFRGGFGEGGSGIPGTW